MERRDRKRKAQEITESPRFVTERINELHSALADCDAMLRQEISELRDEVGSLKKQLEDKTDECVRVKAEVNFLHPDAVVDRVRTKLWHNGDLSILRRVIDPRTRVLRNTEGRGDRSLYLSDVPSKKAGSKAAMNTAKALDLSPKEEAEEASTLTPTPTEPVVSTNMNAEGKQQEDEDFVTVPPASEVEEQVELSPQTEIMNDAVAEPTPELVNDCAT